MLSLPYFWGLFGLCASVYAMYAVLLAIYRVTLHPLAKFPGPRLAAVSYCYEFLVDAFMEDGGKFHFHLERLHDRYGEHLASFVTFACVRTFPSVLTR